jgi:3-oxoadipate enol-lactonase
MSVQVHHVIEGPADGDVVVLSGSLGSNLSMWEPQVRPLTDAGFRVVRYDHRGHGRSPVPRGPYELADIGRDVIALLDTLGVERAHLVGLSLGGMTGMWLGANAADRIASLVLCCTSAQLGPAQMWAERAEAVRACGTAAIADAGVSRWVTPGYAEAHPGRVAALREMIVTTPDEGYAACCGAIERMDLLGELPRISAPTLVIAGADDPSTPPEHAERIVEGVPGARMEIVDGAAHLGNTERPEEFTELILGHLKAAE